MWHNHSLQALYRHGLNLGKGLLLTVWTGRIGTEIKECFSSQFYKWETEAQRLKNLPKGRKVCSRNTSKTQISWILIQNFSQKIIFHLSSDSLWYVQNM